LKTLEFKKIFLENFKNTFFIYSLLIFLSIFLGYRDYSVGHDTENYANHFLTIVKDNIVFSGFEPGFVFLVKFIGIFTNDPAIFFTIYCLIMNVILYKIFDYLFVRENKQIYFIYLIAFLLFSSWYINALTNGIRQGMALILLYYGIISFYKNRNKLLFLIVYLIGISFHYSVVLLLPFIILYLFHYKIVFYFWVLLATSYFLGINETIVEIISSYFNLGIYEYIKYYATEDNSVEGNYQGFILSFFVYTIFWPILFIILNIFYKKYFRFIDYIFIIKTYIILSMPYFVFGFGTYVNRYAVIAWLFIPFFQLKLLENIRIKKFDLFFIAVLLFCISTLFFIFFRLNII